MDTSEVGKKSTIIALSWILLIALVYFFGKYVNFSIYEPATYVLGIMTIGYLFRKIILAVVDSPAEIFSEERILSFFDISDFGSNVESSVKKVLNAKINIKPAIIFLIIETLFVFLLVLVYKDHYKQTYSVLLTFLFFSYSYFLYLASRQGIIHNKKLINILLGVSALGLLVLFLYLENWTYLINLLLTAFCFWSFVVSMIARKELVYALALIMIAILPFLMFFGLGTWADFLGISIFITLSAGLINEFFSEWVFVKD